MLPVIITDFPDSQEDHLLQYVATWKTEFKVAPAYALYLCALRRSTETNSILIQFLKKAAMVIYNKIQNSKNVTKNAFWLRNAAELLYFFKYDIVLSKYSAEAQSTLTNTIQCIFDNLLTNCTKWCNTHTSDGNYLYKTVDAINKTTSALEQCDVNAAFINQLLSFLLQFLCELLILNIEDPLPYYEYFKELKSWAEFIYDECLLNKVMKFARLIEDTVKNVKNTNSVNYIKLKRKPPRFLEEYYRGEYNILIEKATRLLIQIKGGKNRPKDVAPLLLLIPYNGYSCHCFRGIPDWLHNFLRPINKNGWCSLRNQATSSGYWDIRIKGQEVKQYCLTNTQFNIQPCSKLMKVDGVHVAGCSLSDSALTIGDIILSVNGNTLRDITQEKAEILIRESLEHVTVKVVKMNTCELIYRETCTTQISNLPPDRADPEEDSVKFNLVENEKPNYKEDLSQNIQYDQVKFFSDIKKEIEELDGMLENFTGNSDNDRSFMYMKEVMMRNIIKLDNMDTRNSQVVMEERKKTIYFIQEKIAQLKAKLNSNKEETKVIIKDVNRDKNNELEMSASKPVKSTEDVSENQQMPRQHHQLIFETKYSVNKFENKFVSTGIFPSNSRNVPAVKFSDGNLHLVLEMEDWKALLCFERLLQQHFQNETKYHKQAAFGSYKIHFVNTLQGNYVEIRGKNGCINLDQECVHDLLQLSDLINSRMNFLKSMGFDNGFQSIITTVARSAGDPLVEVQKLLNPPANNNVSQLFSYLIMEYIKFYPEVIQKGVELKRKYSYTKL